MTDRNDAVADTEIPEGWDYNPSSWEQRFPVIGLAVSGFFASLCLSLFQTGVLTRGSGPPSGEAVCRVVGSWFSTAALVPEAGLAAVSCLITAIIAAIGDGGRWRTKPALVLLTGASALPLGGLSLLLMTAQPLMFDTWSVFCFILAVISILMIGPVLDEVLATFHFASTRSAGVNARRSCSRS